MTPPRRSDPLWSFFLAALIWLPIWFVIWYSLAPVLCQPIIWLSTWTLDLIIPGIISETLGYGRDLHFATTITVAVQDAPPGTIAEIVVPVNVLIYSWNFPLLLGLLFAAEDRFFSLSRMSISYVALLPFQTWGVVFDVLKTLTIQAGPEVAEKVGIGGWGREAIALGYQFGYLMLPVIAASSIWIALNRPLLATLLTRYDSPQKPPDPPSDHP